MRKMKKQNTNKIKKLLKFYTHDVSLRGTASDWLKQISLAARPIRSTTNIWVVIRDQHRISREFRVISRENHW